VNSTSRARPADGVYGGDGVPDKGILPIVDNDAGNPYDLSWIINRITEPFQTLARDLQIIETNPTQGLLQLEYDVVGVASDEFGHALQFVSYYPEVLALPFAVPVGAAGGLAGLAGLAGIQPDAAAGPAAAPAPTPQTPGLPAASSPPVVTASAAAPASAPAPTPAPTVSTVASSVPTPPAAGGGPGFVPPYAVGPPGIGVGWGMGAQAKTHEPTSRGASKAPAAAAAVAAAVPRRRRRRGQARLRGYGDEYMDMNVEVDPDCGAPPGGETAASDQGAGPLGFAGTVSKGITQAAGLATLSGDDFGAGPNMPMLPGTWDPEGEPADGREQK
jgi:hypothetical protein